MLYVVRGLEIPVVSSATPLWQSIYNTFNVFSISTQFSVPRSSNWVTKSYESFKLATTSSWGQPHFSIPVAEHLHLRSASQYARHRWSLIEPSTSKSQSINAIWGIRSASDMIHLYAYTSCCLIHRFGACEFAAWSRSACSYLPIVMRLVYILPFFHCLASFFSTHHHLLFFFENISTS